MLSDYFYSFSGEKLIKREVEALFITIEGSDGAGKTTQANLLKDYLESAGRRVLLTKEPTINTDIGNKIKRILYGEEKMPEGKEFQKLYIEDRRRHIENEIIPALASGTTVICDRYAFATFAHAMLDTDDIRDLLDLSRGFIMPDIAFMLLTSPETCIKRLKEKDRKLDFFEDIKKIERIDRNYRKLAEDYKNIRIVDSDPPIEDVHKSIIKILNSIIE